MGSSRLGHVLMTGVLVAIGLLPSSGTAMATAQWYALDGADPGTPPTVVLETSSTPEQTDLEITIHGFYFETVVRMSETFWRISLDLADDTPLYRTVGRPQLPALHHTLGSLLGTDVDSPAVQVIDEITIPGVLVYPAQELHSANDPAPPFQWDQAFYQSTTDPYPAPRGTEKGYLGNSNGLDLVGAETYPIRTVPANQTVLVARHYRVSIPHTGTVTPQTRVITRRQSRNYELLLDNFGVINPFVPPDLTEYKSDYLIITIPSFVEELERLADQKRRRGYDVTVATTDTVGSTCNDLKTYIENWWDGDPDKDHYVLIAGDEEHIGTCISPGASFSDRVLACVQGGDAYAEVRLGRLPCSTEEECTDMVDKILEYEDGFPGWFVGRILLAAGIQDDPSFSVVMDNVKDRGYSIEPDPTFVTLYGDDGTTDEDVRAAIEAGAGILGYFGHGTDAGWSRWNSPDNDFDSTDVALLANGTMTPIVFAFACNNGRFDSGVIGAVDGIGENWVQTTQRAVAHYGATELTNFVYAEAFAYEVFERIYDDDIVILSDALNAAEEPLIPRFPDPDIGEITMGEKNAYMYVLFGDPELKIWREDPGVLVIGGYPPVVPPEPGSIEVQVGGFSPGSSRSGEFQAGNAVSPVEFAIVSLYKPGEFQVNRYTDDQGIATLPIDPTSEGWIQITVYTEFDSRTSARDSIRVGTSTGVGAGEPPPVAIHNPWPNPFNRQTVIAYTLSKPAPVRIEVFDVCGRSIALILDRAEGPGRHVVRWNGLNRHGTPVASGVYFARIKVGDHMWTRKMLIAR